MHRPPPRPPAAYIHGVDGPAAIVPARVAAWLDRHADLTRVRVEHRGQDPEVDSVLVALATVARAWRMSVTGQPERTSPDPVPPWLTTSQAADRLHVGPRHVRRLAATGQLTGRQEPDGAWRFDREDVEHYAARRAA